jgi:hypothetical protein
VSTSRPPAGDRLLRAGAVVTLIGIVATIIAMLPLVIPNLSMPPVMWFSAMVIGIGLALVIAGFAVSARARRRSTQPKNR